MHEGESLLEALKRELGEEAGLTKVKIGKFLGVFENFFYYQPTHDALQAYLFFYHCETDQVKLKPDNEINDLTVRGFKWVSPREINRSDLADVSNQIYELLQKFNVKK